MESCGGRGNFFTEGTEQEVAIDMLMIFAIVFLYMFERSLGNLQTATIRAYRISGDSYVQFCAYKC